ncbi:hypothetical protein H5410_003876, partial [Solanum commersonii]
MDKALPLQKMDLYWNQLCQVVENLRPSINHNIVVWNRPHQMMIELAWMEVFWSIMLLRQQLLSIFFQWMKNNGHQQGTIEMDSLLVVDMMKNRTSQNCNLKFIVDGTVDLVGNGDFCCTHCYKEVNTVCDHLVKLATIRSAPMLYSMIKGVYLLDKMQ